MMLEEKQNSLNSLDLEDTIVPDDNPIENNEDCCIIEPIDEIYNMLDSCLPGRNECIIENDNEGGKKWLKIRHSVRNKGS